MEIGISLVEEPRPAPSFLRQCVGLIEFVDVLFWWVIMPAYFMFGLVTSL